MQKVIKKFSSLLLRGHHFIERRQSQNKSASPRRLQYKPDPSRSRIIHFNGNFVVGGTSQLITDIIERTSEKYYHQVIVPKIPEPLPYQPLAIQSYSLPQMAALYEYLEKEKPALVHVHYWVRPMHRYFDFGLWYEAVFRICEELGLKVIQNIDVPTAPFHSRNIVHNVFVSQYVKDQFNNSPVDSSVIYPGSDLSHFSCLANYVFPNDTIGMVYRLDTDKLSKESIEIFISAVKKKPSLRCYIIGGGYYLSYYKKRVNEEGLNKNFIFTGFVSYDVLPEYYKKIGLIVAPVHDESFGQVTPFAMSMGLPVVGFDTGAMGEILGSKRTLVKYGDINALAELIVDTMNEPAKRKQAGLENRERARAFFSVEKMISSYENLYNRYIS